MNITQDRRGINTKRFQFVNWFPEWVGIGNIGPYPTNSAKVFIWRFKLGFFEIRRWNPALELK